ncbi:hypothetical protein DTQ70_07860 [Runella sp. SP2]|nr:hypothetical protein DTQ70_07860 [Runella sp. SP2]
MFRKALIRTLQARPEERAILFESFAEQIQKNAVYEDVHKSWTYHLHTGTDGSRIFRGGIGFSLVIDPQGRLWRAATHEDFETTYTITPTSCEIDTMRPLYATMREYVLGYYES